MKRIILSSLILGLASQASNAQVSLGGEVGATYNTLTQIVKGEDRGAKGQNGYRFGLNADLPLEEYSRYHIQAAVVLDLNTGSKSQYNNQTATGSGIPVFEKDMREYKINHVKVPAYFVYMFGDPVYGDNHFFVGLGPVFSFTAGGHFHQIYSNTLNNRLRQTDEDLPIVIGTGQYKDYKAFNIGASAMLGYQLKNGLYAKAYYTYDFNNMNPLADSNNKLAATQAGLTVGIFFKTFKKYSY